jgi:hypothetical protein
MCINRVSKNSTMQRNCEVTGEENTSNINTNNCEITLNTALKLKLTQLLQLIRVQLEPHQCKVYWVADLRLMRSVVRSDYSSRMFTHFTFVAEEVARINPVRGVGVCHSA